MVVSFFPGCTAHSTGLEYSESLHAVFDELGVELVEIDDWNCCGGAAAHSLSNLLGLALPARNIAKAQARDLPLVIPCAACFNSVKKAQRILSDRPEMRKKLEEVIGFEYRGELEVMLSHELITKRIGLDEVKSRIKKPLTGLRVASYYGCLLVRSPEIVQMGDHENPTFLDDFVTLLGGEAVDWSYKTDCCGADLGMTHGKIAVEIADRITGMAIEASADCLMVSCGLCHVNLDMRQSGKNQDKIPIFYFTELIGVAMDLPERDRWWKRHMNRPMDLLKSKNLL